MTKEEIFDLGFRRGQSIAMYIPRIEAGPLEDDQAAREIGITEVDCLADAEMLFKHWATEKESYNRDLHPFELTAHALNNLDAEVDWEVWDVFNDAIVEGVNEVWKGLEHTYRREGLL